MGKPEFVYVTYIETTPEKLWHALTDGDFTERYWFGVRLKSDWKVGSRFSMMRDGAENDAGEVIDTIRRGGCPTHSSTCPKSIAASVRPAQPSCWNPTAKWSS
jgi:hypothetical protein